MANNLLIIDDDHELCELLRDYLSAEGFSISACHTGAEGAQQALAGEYALIILDVMLPELNGFDVLRRIRETSKIPVLMLTARGDDIDRIVGLELGADDYLAKPFEPKELLLRINAILRRVPQPESVELVPKFLNLGPIRYDVKRGEMWQGEQLVRLTATESQLMKIFSKTPSEAVSRTDLVEKLGRDTGQAQERAVDVQITRLRRKIEQDPKQPRYLQTVRGAGYMLAPD